MSERRDEQWLDDQLKRAVAGGAPVFDAESWKRRHRGEYEILLSRRGRTDRRRIRPGRRYWAAGLAVAATVVVAVGLFLVSPPGPNKPIRPVGPAADSAAERMTMGSLRLAYEQGGFDALDQQLQSTLDEFGPRSSSVSLQELF